MATLDQIDKTRLPKHIAIIMDGNGRWAKQRGLERSAGHREGLEALRRIMRAIQEVGVKYVTVYSFSTENWNRPKEEVDALMNLIAWGLKSEEQNMIEMGARLEFIGDISRMPEEALRVTNEVIASTSQGQNYTMIVAFNYGSRDEITRSVRAIAEKVAKGEMKPEDITEEDISRNLDTRNYPDPDLLIRTGGEERISNYLLWQMAYAEMYFTPIFWPDFTKADIYDAIVEFQNRERRFGKTSAQIQEEEKEKLL
ncbi:MAG: isoprenyl transferase [Bacteroidales bacterium]|nr:isoprenyl transferase [Bacteroidales bacterium]